MSAAVSNRTHILSQGEVESIVWWVLDDLDLNLDCVGVRIYQMSRLMHSGCFYGNAHERRPRVLARAGGFPSAVRHVIEVRVPFVPIGPNHRALTHGPPPYWPHTWQECLACITAHEAHHLHEWLYPHVDHPHFSELSAEWTEYETWKRWTERRTT